MSQDHAIGDRAAFMGLDHEARAALRELQPVIRKSIGPALEAFYAKVRATPETRAFFSDEKHIQAASSRQQSHWDEIARGDFDETYVKAVRTIGQTHARIGLEPRWYIGGYAVVSDHLIRAVINDQWPKGFMAKGDPEKASDAVSALIKAVMLDMDFAISIYLETIESERQRLEAVRLANEASQNAVVQALGDALDRLARGDLVGRLSAEVPAEFQKLKDDFNNAVGILEQTMSRVSEATDGIRSGADEIGVAADDLSRRTEQQAASLEETAAALDEITATVRRSGDPAPSRLPRRRLRAPRLDAAKSGDVIVERGGRRHGRDRAPARKLRSTQHHRRDRRDRLSDQPAGPERRGRGGPGRRGRSRLRRRRPGSPRAGPAVGRRGQGDQGADRHQHGPGRTRRAAGRRDRQGPRGIVGKVAEIDALIGRSPVVAGAGDRAQPGQHRRQPDGSGHPAERRHGGGSHGRRRGRRGRSVFPGRE
jgi:methyl-accepting chemotaxis protein